MQRVISHTWKLPPSPPSPAKPSGRLFSRTSDLTPREIEVLRLLVNGDPNKIAAYKLNISPRTVEIHRARAMVKTRCRNFAELVRYAIAEEIISAEAQAQFTRERLARYMTA